MSSTTKATSRRRQRQRLVRLGPTSTVEFPSTTLQPLVESSCDDDVAVLRRRLDRERGYLFLRNLLPRSEVLDARRVILQRMRENGVLDAAEAAGSSNVVQEEGDARMANGAPSLFNMEGFATTCTTSASGTCTDVASHPTVTSLLSCPELYNFFRKLLDTDSIATFDYKWIRAVGTNQYTGVHCDAVYMGRGTTQTLYTVWIPLGDTTVEHGTLAICSGSNSTERYSKIRRTYGRLDVDRDRTEGWLSHDPLEISDKYGGQWATHDFAAGDVVIFGMHTLHASTPNLTERYRLSCDVRFQPADEAMDERWVLDSNEKGDDDDAGGGGGAGEGTRGTGHTSHGKEKLRSMEDARREWGI